MPLFTGLATHDDTKHVGSAKRDIAGGVAGLDSFGNLSIPGGLLNLDNIGGGVTGIVISSDTYAALRLSRLSVKNYVGYIAQYGAYSIIQTERMKNIASGIAGLDLNARIPVLQSVYNPVQYINCNGVVDAALEVSGTGTYAVSQDVTNYSILCDAGADNGNKAVWNYKKGITPGSKPVLFEFEIYDYNLPPGFVSETVLGFSSDPGELFSYDFVRLHLDTTNHWVFQCCDGTDADSVDITAYWGVGFYRILFTDSVAYLFKDDVLIATLNDGLPDNDVYPFARVALTSDMGSSQFINMRNIHICYPV